MNGKAGSGKSTLMSYLCNDTRTQELLIPWATPLPVSIAKFFFWNSGTIEQRSQTGLLRSLLLAVLKQHRELISIVLPWHWSRRYLELTDPSDDAESTLALHFWKLPELVQAFTRLVTQDAIPMRLCLFIDGFDEYEGDYENMAQLFQGITSSPNVKACLSSRQLLAFTDAFSKDSGIRLQDLTFGDIKKYVDDKLCNSPRYQQLALQEPERAPLLVKEIVSKADGVFLWVILVVRSLLDGLGNRDGIHDLQRRLFLLPSDLESLYSHMLKSIDPFYQDRASELFQIFHANWKIRHSSSKTEAMPLPCASLKLKSLTLLASSFATEQDAAIVFQAVMRRPHEDEISQRCEVMADSLKVWCAGLLEIQGSRRSNLTLPHAKIQYLHRTVRDYLEKPEVWSPMLARTTDTQFNPYTSLLISYILQLKIMWPSTSAERLEMWQNTSCALVYASLDDLTSTRANTALIDELDKTMTRQLKTWSANHNCHWSNFDTFDQVQPFNLHQSFLSMAVQYSLCTYVEEKLGNDSRALLDSNGRPLLDFAVNPVPIAVDYPTSARVVALLLKRGARPNKIFRSRTAWENALIWQFLSYGTDDLFRPEHISLGWVHIRASIFKLLLEHGADPRVSIRIPGAIRNYSVAEVVNRCMGQAYEEVAEIRALLSNGCGYRVQGPYRAQSSSFSWVKRLRWTTSHPPRPSR